MTVQAKIPKQIVMRLTRKRVAPVAKMTWDTRAYFRIRLAETGPDGGRVAVLELTLRKGRREMLHKL